MNDNGDKNNNDDNYFGSNTSKTTSESTSNTVLPLAMHNHWYIRT